MTIFPTGRRLATGLLFLAAAALVPAAPAEAQYFGRNKVQYQSFDFHVLKTPHFDIYFYERERPAAELAGRLAERWYARLSLLFGHELSSRQPVIVYGNSTAFQQTNAISGELGEGTGGVTEPLRRRVVLPIGGPLAETDHVLGHELVHAFQFDITTARGAGARGGIPGASYLPLWFIEGMAEYFSLGPVDPNTAMWMRDAIQHRFPRYGQLEDPRFFPYRFGQALLAYIGGEYGDTTVVRLLRAAAMRRDIGAAITQVLGMKPDTLVARWHAATRAAYDPLTAVTAPPTSTGRLLAGPQGEESQYNVSPSVSPDGRWMMFLSNRGIFSIDLYLADARTGQVVRRLTSTAVDPHFQSLQFIGSAGAWDAASRRFAFAGITGGRPVLDVYDVEQRKRVREIKLPMLGEVLNPTWSPDGQAIAFSALEGGFADLFVYDLQRGSLRRLTNDAYADLEPAWSPDGRTIAFVTDRFTTRLDSLIPGRYELALLDVASDSIRRAPIPVPSDSGTAAAPATGATKAINPQWGPGGRTLYYLSDPRGITNIYRLDLASGRVDQLTDLYTGAAGITSLSPALAVATGAGSVIYSAYANEGYGIYTLDSTATLARAAPDPPATRIAAVLPPQDRTLQGIPSLLANDTLGHPAEAPLAVHPYRATLGLDYVAQPSLAVGASRYGTFIGGGTALYFSDMLGNHNLVAGLQVGGTFRDVFALVGYQNLSHRLNWSVTAQQLPLLTGAFSAGFTQLDSQTVYVEQQLLYRETQRQFGATVAYPFNQVQRVELSAAYLNIGFNEQLTTQAFDQLGNLVVDQTQDIPTSPALNLGTASAALVYDNSLGGATGPILGQRYRLEVTPYIGSLSMVDLLADVRKYVVPVRPFTIAGRLLHYGHYGRDSDDPRLSPQFLGYDGLVRGYTFGSFDASECQPTASNPNACPAFDQLLGSRMLVGNLELRFPLFGLLGIGSGYYGAFPAELAFFGDGGVAWDKTVSPTFFGGTRKPVWSTGAALRINLLGFAVAQVDLVHPFDRPQKNWVWQFSLVPGF